MVTFDFDKTFIVFISTVINKRLFNVKLALTKLQTITRGDLVYR